MQKGILVETSLIFVGVLVNTSLGLYTTGTIYPNKYYLSHMQTKVEVSLDYNVPWQTYPFFVPIVDNRFHERNGKRGVVLSNSWRQNYYDLEVRDVVTSQIHWCRGKTTKLPTILH